MKSRGGFPRQVAGGKPGGLVSVYGSALHGYHRGPPAFYPEPVDAWLSALMDAVPFYRRCMIVCPSTVSDERAASLLRRAREHLPSAHLSSLRRRVWSDSRRPDLMSSLHGKGKESSTQITSKVLPTLLSPLEGIPPKSLDLVVFAANVFGTEMLHDAPWHMSLAHRCLAPHGVVVIMGYATRVCVAAPEAARKDADDFMEYLQRTAREVAEKTELQDHCVAMNRALDISSSLDVGHADTYFPFPATKRRWFLSEHAATPAQLAASYRALPEYQLLSKETLRYRRPLCCGNDEIWGGEAIEEQEPVNVFRRHSRLEPLEALQGCLEAQLVLPHGKNTSVLPPLRIHVRHFVITCSSRSMNASPESSPQLPPAAGRRMPPLK